MHISKKFRQKWKWRDHISSSLRPKVNSIILYRFDRIMWKLMRGSLFQISYIYYRITQHNKNQFNLKVPNESKLNFPINILTISTHISWSRAIRPHSWVSLLIHYLTCGVRWFCFSKGLLGNDYGLDLVQLFSKEHSRASGQRPNLEAWGEWRNSIYPCHQSKLVILSCVSLGCLYLVNFCMLVSDTIIAYFSSTTPTNLHVCFMWV